MVKGDFFLAWFVSGGKKTGTTCKNQYKSLLATDLPDLGGLAEGWPGAPLTSFGPMADLRGFFSGVRKG